MRRALDLAGRAWGETHPNPMVGALIVENGAIVAEGWHRAAGQPHAEVAALAALGRRPAEGAILVVTLEPCSTAGRTGACTDAILAAGIRRVIVGANDPNPEHQGRGLRLLREAGVEVIEGVLSTSCSDLNLIFNHWIRTGRPLIAGKAATTLDGCIATASGESKWITGLAARQDVMRWRRYFPAIMAGPGTLLADDPQLTSRPEGGETWCPRRFVLDRTLRTARAEKLPQIYRDDWVDRTTVVTLDPTDPEARTRLEKAGVRLWSFPATNEAGEGLLTRFLRRLRDEGLTGLLCEGGTGILSALIAERRLDYFFAYRAPKILGDRAARPVLEGRQAPRMLDALQLADVQQASFGDDQLIRGRVLYPEETG